MGCVQVLAPLFRGGRGGKSLLETNISELMADSAASLSFGQDWTCLSEGELALDNICTRRMGKCIKTVT